MPSIEENHVHMKVILQAFREGGGSHTVHIYNIAQLIAA